MKHFLTTAILFVSLMQYGAVHPAQVHAAARPILFVVDADYPPINFIENGSAKGLCIDIIKALSAVTHQDMPVRLMAWDRAQNMVRRGEADALSLLAISQERRADYDFTDTVMSIEYSLFVRNDEVGISGLEDLKGKAIGVTAGGFPHQALLSQPGINLVIVASYQDGLHRLLNGTIQAFAGDKWVALYQLHQDNIGDIKALDKPFAVREAAFAVRKGNQPLRDELNRGLAELKRRGVLREILQKWSGKQIVVMTREKIKLGIAVAVSSTALVLVTLLSLWVYTLKRTKSRLAASEERYRILVEKAPDAIIVFDLDLCKITDANGKAERLFGCGRKELIGCKPQRFFNEVQPDGLPVGESMDTYQNRAIAGEEVTFERSIHNLWGSDLICEVRLVALPAPGHRLIRASFLDVTGRKLAELKQHRSEEQFRDIFENAPFGIYQTSAEGRLLSINPTGASMFGYEANLQMLAATSDVVSQLFVQPGQRQALVQQALASDGFVHREVEYRRRDGSRFDAVLYMRAVPAGDGSLDYFEGFIEDITLRKKALSELRKLSQAVEQSPASIVITDTDGTIEFINPKFSQLTGYRLDEALGQKPCLLKSGKMRVEVYRDLWSAISSGRVWEGELHNRKKNGDLFWERATISPLRDGAGVITNFLAVKEDITEQKNMKEQLFQSQKMEAIGQLAGGIAHDFNNILTVILGYANMLSMAPGLEASYKQKVDRIINSADKAAQLNRALLAFSRKQIMDPKPAELNDIVRQVQTFLGRIIGEDVHLKLVTNAPEIKVRVDRSQIEQVLMNLATNARDAMPKGGLLIIETDIQEISLLPNRTASLHSPGRYAVVSVSDNGTGMEQATLSHIFEPFFTTKEVGKGTGLGMAIVHGVINQHNGFINVYSEPGQGTTFKIYLPLSDGAGQEEVPQAVAEPVKGGNETILLAEDDAAVGELEREILTEYGYRVLLACDGEEAVVTFGEHRDGIKLVVMDMIMPKKSGWEAAREINRLKPGTRILFTSGYTKDFIKSRGELEEGTELIMKPVQPMELLRTVRAMLDC